MLVTTYTTGCEKHNTKTNSNFLRSLPEDPRQLLTIDLSLNFVGKNGLLPVIETARAAPCLTTLVLRDNFVSNDTLIIILDILQGHPSLTSVDVSNNPISHACAKRLISFIKTNVLITDLKLDGTLLNVASVKNLQKKASERRASYVDPESGSEPQSRQSTEVFVPTAAGVNGKLAGQYFNVILVMCKDEGSGQYPYMKIIADGARASAPGITLAF